MGMTSAEHYREAENLLEISKRDVSLNWPEKCGENKSDVIASAQVHALLALVWRTSDQAPEEAPHA
jgi:hypothetical protein